MIKRFICRRLFISSWTILIAFLISWTQLFAQVEDLDGNVYPTAKFNTQHWMLENLMVTHDTAGNLINWKTASINESCCHYYDYNTAQSVCPVDYRLPREQDWTVLFQEVTGVSTPESKDLASSILQNNPFGLLLAGGYVNMGTALVPPFIGYYWTSQKGPQLGKYVHFQDQFADFMFFDTTNFFNVRCIKDELPLLTPWITFERIWTDVVKLQIHSDAEGGIYDGLYSIATNIILKRKLASQDDSQLVTLDTIQIIEGQITYDFVDSGLIEGQDYQYVTQSYNESINSFKGVANFTTGMTRIIPDDYNTVEEAIDVSDAGDALILKDGEYFINITLKNLFLKSENGPESVIIRPQNGTVPSIIADGKHSEIIGLTFEDGGAGSEIRISGGSISIIPRSDVKIDRCIFRNNDSYGAVHIWAATSHINNSLFYNNYENLVFSSQSRAIIINTTFVGDRPLLNIITTGTQPSIIFNSILTGGAVGNYIIHYSNVSGGWIGNDGQPLGEGNVDAEIKFKDSTNLNFNLSRESILIGGGSKEIEINGQKFVAPEIDLYGNPRPNPQTSNPDIGAIESEQDVPIPKINQTITFNDIPNKLESDPPFELDAMSSSGLEVNLESSDTTVATLSGKTVTITGAGSSTITASQAGNDTYNAAPEVTRVLIVNAVTGINDKSLNGAINLYPNPINHELKIVLSISQSDPVTFRIVDLSGKHLRFKWTKQKENYLLNVSDFKAGIYFITIETKGQFSTHRFLKR